jgi:NTP pyrophosphatase (non-canonical NTP hydrolase)
MDSEVVVQSNCVASAGRIRKVIVAMDVINEVEHERKQQDKRWGTQNHSLERWMIILTEELGEACEALLTADLGSYRGEMVQIAAVAVAAIESYDRMTDSLAQNWEKEMENCGFFIDWCNECGGPALCTEDAFECFRCGRKSQRQDHEAPLIGEMLLLS